MLQHSVIRPLPVRTVIDGAPLISPPDDVAGVDYELGAPALDCIHNLVRHPRTAFKAKDRSVHAPGRSFTSSTEVSVIQPRLSFSVVCSEAVYNGKSI